MSAPYKLLLTVDAETRWSTSETSWCGPEGFTLSKMTTEEYIRSPLFYAFGFCIHEFGTDKPIQWYSHDELPKIFGMYDWSTTAVLAHNAMFDVGIMSMVYGVKPCFIFDSLSMARALRGVEVGNSLAKLANTFQLPAKGTAVHNTNGMEFLPAHIEKELAEYCKHDVFLCEAIFSKLLMNYNQETQTIGNQYPASELKLVSMTLKMFTEPALVLDIPMLEQAVVDDTVKLETALVKAGVEESTLASNQKFAELLTTLGVEPPMKKSKTTGLPALALAKSDALFQALLNGDNEEVALLCEARLRVKSTLERTRAQRFIEIAGRGALPVPLSYYGAGTGRWAATGKINLQNMKRGSFLRKAICAPEGYSLVVGDLSQIEPRVLAWLADYHAMLDIFRAGGDPYATFGSQMFTIAGLTKESHPLLRQSAKSAMLGCFGRDTKVLTQRGWVPIVNVLVSDTTWDGLEWTQHQGVVARGEKATLWHSGVHATSDHEIWTERGWAAWSEVRTDPYLFRSALSLGSLPASAGTPVAHTKKQEGTPSSPGCAVHVDGKVTSTALTYVLRALHAVTGALRLNPIERSCSGRGLKRFVLAQCIESVYSHVCPPSSAGAATQPIVSTLTTVVAVLQSILRGLQTALRFSPTLSPSTAGISLSFSSTAPTIARGTNRATYASSPAVSTWPTSARSQPEKSLNCASASQPLKQRMQTYDIAMAGPRNRYTVLTDDGPIIVHNCGYQLGWASFAGQLLTGFLGAPPVRYTKQDARQLGVTQEMAQKFLDWEENIKRMAEIPHTCTAQELLVHCLASKAIIDKYRAAAEPVTEFWKLLGELIPRSLVGGEVVEYKCLTFKKGEIVLANGMSLLYPDIEVEKDEKGRAVYSYMAGVKRTKLYAGKICNNVTQGTARIVMTDGLLRVDKHFPVKGTVHDEGIFLVEDERVVEATPWIKRQMVKEPKWMPGIPLNADVGYGKRYGLVK